MREQVILSAQELTSLSLKQVILTLSQAVLGSNQTSPSSSVQKNSFESTERRLWDVWFQ